MAAAGIPRIAGNVTSSDWDDQNAYPLDPSGTGGTFMHPGALLEAGVKKVGIIRVDLPNAGQLAGLIGDLYEDDGMTIVSDAAVPAGTTDFSQFILGAEDAGAEGVSLSLGEQEAVQVLRAGQQLGTELPDRPRDRDVLAQGGRRARATSRSTWCSTTPSRRPPSTSRSTRRCGPTWRPRARTSSSRPRCAAARCGPGSASTRCSG